MLSTPAACQFLDPLLPSPERTSPFSFPDDESFVSSVMENLPEVETETLPVWSIDASQQFALNIKPIIYRASEKQRDSSPSECL